MKILKVKKIQYNILVIVNNHQLNNLKMNLISDIYII
jgi:hypothetical protein